MMNLSFLPIATVLQRNVLEWIAGDALSRLPAGGRANMTLKL
jgi:hypothetical protein